MSFRVKNNAVRLCLSATAVALLITLLFPSCRKPAEPIVEANYYINNLTPNPLRIQAIQGTASVPLIMDTIKAFRVEKFYHATEGTGGHPYPSNFFSEFKVFSITANGDSLVYEGVTNSDWKQENNDNEVIELVLKIDY